MTAALPLPKPFDLEEAIRDAVADELPAMREREAKPRDPNDEERMEEMMKAVNQGWFVEWRRERDAERKIGER